MAQAYRFHLPRQRNLAAARLALPGAVIVAAALFCRLARQGVAPHRIAVEKTVGNWETPCDALGYRMPK